MEQTCESRGHHAWTWLRDDSYQQVCDDCGAERLGRAELPAHGQVVASMSKLLNDALSSVRED